MHDLIATFLECRSRIEGNRQSTVERLRRICCRRKDFLSSNRQRTLEKARPEDLLAFIACRQDEGASEVTIRGELCAIRTLYAYHLERQRVGSRSPLRSIRSRAIQRSRPGTGPGPRPGSRQPAPDL
jgi:site-specific recombinase XerD